MSEGADSGRSQRQKGYTGGIHPGHNPSSEQSLGLEAALRQESKILAESSGLKLIRGYSGAELAGFFGKETARPIGVLPDGGVWTTKDGRPLMAVEAKFQGQRGNAIERWFKNWSVLRAMGVQRYITFCSGEGFYYGRSSQRTLEAALLLDWRDIDRDPQKVWNTPEGFTWLYRYPNKDAARKDIRSVLYKALGTLEI